jgi:hypothetical protein
MTRTSDINWIMAQSMPATLLTLAWMYIPRHELSGSDQAPAA